jgi:hypothetical protein
MERSIIMSKKNKQKYPLQDRVLSSGLDELNLRLEILIMRHELAEELLRMEVKYLKSVLKMYKQAEKEV